MVINDINPQLKKKKTEKEQKSKYKESTQKERIKIKEINKENREMDLMNTSKSGFLKKFNKKDKPLANLIQK